MDHHDLKSTLFPAHDTPVQTLPVGLNIQYLANIQQTFNKSSVNLQSEPQKGMRARKKGGSFYSNRLHALLMKIVHNFFLVKFRPLHCVSILIYQALASLAGRRSI